MDALLGAAALGDIGQLFPDSDDAFLNISSLTLLSRVRGALTRARIPGGEYRRHPYRPGP